MLRKLAWIIPLIASLDVHAAEQGRVIWRNLACAFFIVETDAGGYGLYEWLSGPKPSLGDVISGELDREGSHVVMNATLDKQMMKYTSAYTRSRTNTFKAIPPICRKVEASAESLEQKPVEQKPVEQKPVEQKPQ